MATPSQREKSNEPKTPEFSEIIKIFSVIKKLINLEDTETIPSQITRLEQFETSEALHEIIEHLESNRYRLAVREIEEYTKQNHQITVYKDPDINELKLEAKSLESEHQALSDEKAEMDKLIFKFNVRHAQELGSLIIKILAYKKKFAKTKKERQEAKQDEKEYNQEYKTRRSIKINKLSEEEEKELKKAYREGSKLCHPDAVSARDKEKAARFFIQLSEAYERNDIEKINKILQQLKTGGAFTDCADSLTKKEQLLMFVESLREKISILLRRVNSIKTSEEYQTISGIRDWDVYFQTQKEQLIETLKQMQNG